MGHETAGWKVARVLLGLALLGITFGVWLSHGSVRDVEPLWWFTLVGCVLLTTGVGGLVRLRRDRASGTPTVGPVWWAWFAGALVLALPLAAGCYVTGRALNLRAWETLWWTGLQAEDTSHAAWMYLFVVSENHEPLASSRADPDKAAAVERLLGVVSGMSEARGPLYQLKVHLDEANRTVYNDLSWWLDTFTQVRTRFPEAARLYAERRFTEVMKEKKTGELRAYRLEFPGLHDAETHDALAEKYREAEARYATAIAGRGTNPEAVAGVRALFTHLGQHDVDAFTLPVSFLPVAGLEAALLEEAVKTATGAKEVVPVAPSFTPELAAARSESLRSSMNQALEPVVGDLFELATAPPEETRQRARFLVGQRVFPSGSVYTDAAEQQRPMAERTLYMGIGMTFDSTIQLPEPGQALKDDVTLGHRFSLDARPAPDIRAMGDADGVSAGAVYGAMASSAFADFRVKLLAAYGLGAAK